METNPNVQIGNHYIMFIPVRSPSFLLLKILYTVHVFPIVNTHVSCKKTHQFGWILPTPRHFSLPRSSTFSCHQGQPWRRWNASDRSGCSQCRCRRGRVHRSKLGTGHRSTMVYLFIRLIIPNEWMKFIDILCSWQCWSWFASSCFN